MAEQQLKTWPEFFEAVASGNKTFEVRRDDRYFRVGDVLVLREYEPTIKRYTGREIRRTVTYKLRGGRFGIDPDFCVLGLSD